MTNQENPKDFDLDEIIHEFQADEQADSAAPEDDDALDLELQDLLSSFAEPAADEENAEASAEDAPEAEQASAEEAAAEEAEPASQEAPEPADTADTGDTIRFEGSAALEPESESIDEEVDTEDTAAEEEPESAEAEAAPEAAESPREPIPFSPKNRLRDLKRKLVAGPEKRYYDLTEIGLGKLRLAIILNAAICLLCVITTTFFSLDLIPENRLRFVVFTQVLAMMLSALLGTDELLDGLGEIFHARFTPGTLLALTFAACAADAVFCLMEQRVPCCSAFALEMTFALCARYHRRKTEMEQMDTLRKAVNLQSIVKEPDFSNGKPGILRGEGDVEDFMDTYTASSGPEKVQCIYAFLCLIVSLGIAALAAVRHTPAVAVQVLSTSLLVAFPASFFIAVSRPTGLLQRRLHMVGSVICGWQGVKKLCGKAVFPLRDADLFPNGATKLNGIKFYSDREPDEILSYTTSLIAEAGGGLVPVFQKMLSNRGGVEYPVTNFRDYGSGGIGGEIAGEPVLLGSLDFLQDMGVDIPQGTMVNQAIYAAIDGQLSAVVAISYAKMRSASAGLVSLLGNRKLTPVLTAGDFMITEEFIRSKFSVRTRRMVFPDRETRTALAQRSANPESDVLALSVRSDLVSIVYAVCGARALRLATCLGTAIHMLGGILGLLCMFALAYLGNTELLSPTHILMYQLVWMIPGVLITEWTRSV